MPQINDIADSASPKRQPYSKYLRTSPILTHRSSTTDSFDVKVRMNLSVPVMAGIIAGTLAFGVIVFVSWCLIKQRRAHRKRKLIFSPYIHPRSLVPPLSAMTTPVTQDYNPYSQVIPHQFSQQEPTPSFIPQSKASVSPGEPSSTQLPTSLPKHPQVLRETEFAYLTVPSTVRNTWPMSSVEIGASLLRQNSVDTASMYSCASAPLDAHEQSDHPFSFNSAAPPWVASHDDRFTTDSGYVWPMRRIQLSDPPMQQIREELAPETYSRAQRKTEFTSGTSSRSHYRPASSDSKPSVPSLPEQIDFPVIVQPPTAFLNDDIPFSPYLLSPNLSRKPANRTSFPSSLSIKTISTTFAMPQYDQESPEISTATASSQHFPLTPTSWYGEVPPWHIVSEQ